MRCLLIQRLFWSLLIVLQWGGHECCLKDERMALLQIKAFFKKINGSDDGAHHVLPSWLGDDTDCCTWERVTCNPSTDRVIELNLNHLRQNAISVYLIPKHSLDMSLFSPFEKLVNLQLSGNGFNCCLQNQGFDKLIHLKRLEVLNLAFNYFENNILRSLGAVTTLRSLNLSTNAIFGHFPLPELSNLTNLKMLDLNDNSLNGSLAMQEVGSLKNIEILILRHNLLNSAIPFEAFTSLNNLKVLDLSENNLMGSIHPAIGALSALVALSLAGNNLTGTLPSQGGFCMLKSLEELDLSFNNIEGVLPPCFCNLTSLRLLDLSTNQFKGEISFIFPSLRSIEYIRLGNNHFDGKLSFGLLANHSKAKIVEILNNGNLEVETEDSKWIPTFQLEVLVLSGCTLNKQIGNIPSFLAYQSMLKLLDLSHNTLRGSFPDWVIKNNSELGALNLRNNSFEGKLHMQPHLNTSIFWIDVSDNLFNGKLQENVGRMLPQIKYLNLSSNYFEGFVQSSFCNMSQLGVLDLSNNYFEGEIAREIISGCLSMLRILILSVNRFHGQIFSANFNMTTLENLQLEENHFSGPISNAISRSYQLDLLDASNNDFSGELGSWISNMTNLLTLIIQNNSLNGPLPRKLPKYLFLLDASHNLLSGALPSCPFELEHALLGSNKFAGSIPETLLNSSNLLTLDIRDNHLFGNFPSILGAKNLRILLLSRNQLSGSLPNQLCKLQMLNLIDLSNNNISGQIPGCISNIAFGKPGSYFKNVEVHYYWIGSIVVTYGNFLVNEYDKATSGDGYQAVVSVDFVTKKRADSYKGDILNYMSGLDLSHNNLTGEIPCELGNIMWIHSLNLSHNQIEGPIPKTFSKLKQLESLDLSYNNLIGEVPSELNNLNFLAVFSVAHNNLSGKILEMKGQFGTFDQSSYEGNPHLCGAPLVNNCSHMSESPISPIATSELTNQNKWYEMDMLVFWVAFVVAYIIFFLGVVMSLYVNPSWNRRLFNFMYRCYYACYHKFCT